jgi:hypothetical protein
MSRVWQLLATLVPELHKSEVLSPRADGITTPRAIGTVAAFELGLDARIASELRTLDCFCSTATRNRCV